MAVVTATKRKEEAAKKKRSEDDDGSDNDYEKDEPMNDGRDVEQHDSVDEDETQLPDDYHSKATPSGGSDFLSYNSKHNTSAHVMCIFN